MKEVQNMEQTTQPKVTERSKQGEPVTRLKGWEWTEPCVWTESMLTALVSGVKGGKWYSLMDKVYSLKTLTKAWEKVRKNAGAAGVDKESVEMFEDQATERIQKLHKELKEGRYRAEGVRRVNISKGGGKKRPLGIPTVKDRIVQTALKMVLEPIFEKEFAPTSYGFRPGRGCFDALREVDELVKRGYTHVVDADIQNYFDSIPHERLLSLVKEKVSDGRVIDLIGQYLRQAICEEAKQWIPQNGSPQGAVISPLLSNLYLHPLDQRMKTEGKRIVRYADDVVILCESRKEAEDALKLLQSWTEENGLTLHPEKTKIGNCVEPGEGFEFLGYRFECGKRNVRKKSLMAMTDRIRQKTKRTSGNSMKQIVSSLNRTLRGWFEYFKHANKWTFPRLDQMIRRRLRAIHRKQEGRPGFGKTREDHKKWPNSHFASLGLFSLQQAHWEACQP